MGVKRPRFFSFSEKESRIKSATIPELQNISSETLEYIEVLQRGLQVMDSTAISLCMDNKIQIVVFNVDKYENILKAAVGEPIGTTVGGKK